MKILLAEDERELSNALCAILRYNNYSVDAVYNGQEALDYVNASENGYDGIILDIMMPRLTGIEVLSKLRHAGNAVPIMLLTAKSEVEDKILGLDTGADDYLAKPFDMGELLARLRAMTRRKTEIAPDILSFADMKLNRTTFEIVGADGSFRLGNKEFQMLEMMMANPSNLISTEQFMERIWGYDTDAEINVVWVCISALRKRLCSIGTDVTIRATRNIGYSLEVGTGK